MIALSTRAKEAIKVGLAMAIAYGIALQMDWDRPYWAAFAVAFISLPTVGQSLRKGALRMLGTLVAGVAALTMLALFPQERWWFMAVLSVYVGLCTYMVRGGKNPYFYQVSAFVCVIICFDSGVAPSQAFQTAVERIQETGMGILVYSLVAVFLWPRSTADELKTSSLKLFATQLGLYRSYRALMSGTGSGEDSRGERLQEVQLLGQLGAALEAAEADTYAVWEVRHPWRRFLGQSRDLMEALEHWRESFPEVQQLDLSKLLPNLDAVCLELAMRFEQVQRMLGGEAPDRAPQPSALTVDRVELAALSHFERAAVAVIKSQLDRLEAISRSLFDCVQAIQDIRDFGGQASIPPREKTPGKGLALDPDRMAAVVSVLSAMWLAFLLWVYLDPPGHSGFVVLATSLALGLANAPQVRVPTLFPPVILSCVFAGVLYVFVMPHLSGFMELALMIFAATFAIAYLFSRPQQGLSRAAGLAFFAVITGIDNQQTYSFLSFADSMAMAVLILALLVVTAYIPFPPQPEKAFLRLLCRFFRYAEFLVSRLALERNQRRGIGGRWKTALYRNHLLELPGRLGMWGAMIDHRLFPGTSPEQVQALVTSLHALAYRIGALVDAREYPQAEMLVRELKDDVRAWRLAIERRFQGWATDPAAASCGDLQERLAAILDRLESRIDKTFDKIEQGKLSAEDYENFYRLLGSYRGLSEAVVAHGRLAEGIGWDQWREARF